VFRKTTWGVSKERYLMRLFVLSGGRDLSMISRTPHEQMGAV
jgi:hypothetical protein